MPYNRKLVFAAACMGTLIFGVVLTTLGTILPSLTESFGVDKAEAGSLFLLMSLGILVSSVIFGPVVDRFGFKMPFIVSTLLVFACLEGIAFAASFGQLQLVVIGIGLGGGVLNGGTNALVADISEETRSASLSLLGVFFGLGAFGMPFALGFLLEHFAYGTLIAWVGAIVLVPVLYMMAITFPAPKHDQGFPIKDALGLLRDPLLILMGLMLFIQSGIEITASGWITTFFHEELGLRADHSAFFLSLFWLGMILARLLLNFLLLRVAPGVVLRGFIAVSALAGILLVVSPSVWVAAPAVFLIGAGLSAGFPVLLGFAGDRYATLSGTAYSILFVMALAGGSILPFLTGIIAEAVDLRTAFLLIPVVLVMMFLLLLVVLRRMKGEESA